MESKIEITGIQKVEGQKMRFPRGARERLMQFFVEAPTGYYTLRVSRARKSKSEAQLGAIFGLMIERVIAFCDDNGWDTSDFLREMVRDDLPTGVAPSKDLIKDLLYSLCPIYNEDGKRITLSQSDTKQAAEFYTNCTTLLASRGIYVPDPDPNWKDKL
jgi:hypothetical protein